MATYTEFTDKPNGKGRVVKYQIQAKITLDEKDENGESKVKFKSTTWYNTENLPRRNDQPKSGKVWDAVNEFGRQWEKQIKGGAEIEKVKKSKPMTFEDVAKDWIANKGFPENHRRRCEDAIKVFCGFKDWKTRMITDFDKTDMKEFFTYISTKEYDKERAQLKQSAKEILDKAITDYGVNQAEKDGWIKKPTLYNAKNLQIIEWNTAKTICDKL
jgi:hypothetical protein